MNKIIIALFAFVLSSTVPAQSPWYFGTGEAVNLTNGIAYNNGIKIIAGALDPSAVAVNAPAGSFYQSTSGTVYVKQDAGLSTNWLPIGVAAPSSLSTINGQSGPAVSLLSGSAGTDFAISASSNNITFDIPTSSASNRGLLSAANWSTFNSKEPAIAAGTTGQYWRGDKSWQTLDKAAVGLANADNTSDANKPISTATQTALDLKADLASPTFTGTVSGITKAMVGLGNVDNTSDANKPVSTATQTALDLKQDAATAATDAELTAGLATKQDTIVGAATTIVSADLGTDSAVVSNGSGKIAVLGTVSTTELGYINNVTSAIQTQLDGKEPAFSVLPLSDGGTEKALTPVLGGIVYTDAGSMEILPAGTSGQILRSNGAAAPSWTTSSATLKTCYYKFGGASATLAAPTECTTGTCVEVEDTCGTISPPIRSAQGFYTDLTIASGTFANNASLFCDCKVYDITTNLPRGCSPMFITGDQTWAANSSGGAVLNFTADDQAGASYQDGYGSIKCEGQAP